MPKTAHRKRLDAHNKEKRALRDALLAEAKDDLALKPNAAANAAKFKAPKK